MKFLMIYLFFITTVFASSKDTSHDNIDNTIERSHLEHGDHDDHNHIEKEKEDEHSEDHDHDSENHSEHDEHADHGKEADEHGHGEGKAMGEGKAIVEIDEVKGLKLSKEAIESLSIKFEEYTATKKIKIAKKTLVTSKGQKGIYRFREGFFKLISIKIIKEESNYYLVSTSELDLGDKIVVSGVGLLRVSDIYSTDKSEYGHSH